MLRATHVLYATVFNSNSIQMEFYCKAVKFYQQFCKKFLTCNEHGFDTKITTANAEIPRNKGIWFPNFSRSKGNFDSDPKKFSGPIVTFDTSTLMAEWNLKARSKKFEDKFSRNLLLKCLWHKSETPVKIDFYRMFRHEKNLGKVRTVLLRYYL